MRLTLKFVQPAGDRPFPAYRIGRFRRYAAGTFGGGEASLAFADRNPLIIRGRGADPAR